MRFPTFIRLLTLFVGAIAAFIYLQTNVSSLETRMAKAETQNEVDKQIGTEVKFVQVAQEKMINKLEQISEGISDIKLHVKGLETQLEERTSRNTQ